jgi:hypothetical protein
MLALVGCGKAQDPPKVASASGANSALTAAPTAPEPPPRPGRLDLKATAVDAPQDRDGQPAAEVLDALLRLEVGKGKYESDAEHAKRLKALAGSKLSEEVVVGDVVGYRPTNVRYWYDANKQAWQYEIPPESVNHTFNHVLVYKQTLDPSPFTAYFSALHRTDLEFTKDIYLDIGDLKKGLSYINGATKIPSKDAPSLDGNLTVLLVGRHVPNFVSKGQAVPSDHREKEVMFQHTLAFKLDGVWLVHKQTGQILSKTWTIRRLT